jgi:ADP-ribose pyrophosphatase YjhB (NUDIX family)
VQPNTVRPIAIAIIRRGERIFVAEGTDEVAEETFYRPLGGLVEFGERGSDTVRREIREEIGAELANVRYLGTIENIFTYNGEAGHEIVMVYEADFADPAMYDKPEVMARENGAPPFTATWKGMADFGPRTPLYPAGLLDKLTEWAAASEERLVKHGSSRRDYGRPAYTEWAD